MWGEPNVRVGRQVVLQAVQQERGATWLASDASSRSARTLASRRAASMVCLLLLLTASSGFWRPCVALSDCSLGLRHTVVGLHRLLPGLSLACCGSGAEMPLTLHCNSERKVKKSFGHCGLQNHPHRLGKQAPHRFMVLGNQSVCREAGAVVALNVLVRNLNVDRDRQNPRRIEVIANGLPLWGGAQLAADTMLVSPFTAAGLPRRAGGVLPELPCSLREVPKSARTPNCAGPTAAGSQSWLLRLEGVGVPALSACLQGAGRGLRRHRHARPDRPNYTLRFFFSRAFLTASNGSTQVPVPKRPTL